jgi:integrase
VNVPGSLTNTGKRERHFHKTRDLAKIHAATLREKAGEHGSGASIIKPSLAEDATRAAAILGPWGLSLTEAAQRIAAAFERESASKTIEEAGKAWIKSMSGLRERSIKSYKVTLKRMTAALSGRILTTIGAEELLAAISAKGTAVATYALHRRNARAFWNWSAKKGWCDKKVFENVDAPRKSEDKEITFLSPEEAKTLLQTAEEAYPLAVPLYALALFAGIRAEELNRLEADHVTLNGIELPAEVTKKGRRRHIVPNATLKAWLKIYPFVPCSNWRHVDCAVRRLAGWNVSAALLEEPPEPTRGKWPQNALRHSHASYAIASGILLESLLFEFGHVGGVDVLRKHYLGRATKVQAADFFAIGPKDQTLKIAPDRKPSPESEPASTTR